MRKLITFVFLIAAVIAQTPDDDDEYKLPGGVDIPEVISVVSEVLEDTYYMSYNFTEHMEEAFDLELMEELPIAFEERALPLPLPFSRTAATATVTTTVGSKPTSVRETRKDKDHHHLTVETLDRAMDVSTAGSGSVSFKVQPKITRTNTGVVQTKTKTNVVSSMGVKKDHKKKGKEKESGKEHHKSSSSKRESDRDDKKNMHKEKHKEEKHKEKHQYKHDSSSVPAKKQGLKGSVKKALKASSNSEEEEYENHIHEWWRLAAQSVLSYFNISSFLQGLRG